MNGSYIMYFASGFFAKHYGGFNVVNMSVLPNLSYKLMQFQ